MRPTDASRGLLGRVGASVDLRLLGPFEVVDGAGTVLEVPGARPSALLALLALHTPDVVSTDRILEELWGNEDVKSPESALHVAVSRLRSVIGEGVVETGPGGDRRARLDRQLGLPNRHRPGCPRRPAARRSRSGR